MMEQYIDKIWDLIDSLWDEKYGNIDWRYDIGTQKDVMEKMKRDTKMEIREAIQVGLQDADNVIEEWEQSNEDRWNKEDLENIIVDNLYEARRDEMLWH